MLLIAGPRGKVNAIIRETMSALKKWPDTNHWVEAVKISVPALLIIALLGYFGGWVSWNPMTDWQALLPTLIVLFFLPAFFEELFFRGLLLSWLATRSKRWAAWIATIVFVLWHPLQAFTIGPAWSAMFLHPTFWLSTLILGIILAHIRIKSQSLWPPILVHWFVVIIWKSLLGGSF